MHVVNNSMEKLLGTTWVKKGGHIVFNTLAFFFFFLIFLRSRKSLVTSTYAITSRRIINLEVSKIILESSVSLS